MNIGTLRQALQTRLDTVTGVRAHAEAPGSVTAASGGAVAVVFYGDPLLTRDSRDTWIAQMVVRLMVPASNMVAAQTTLDGYLPDVIAALETGTDTTVVQVDEPGAVAYGQVTYLAADLTVSIMVLD
jgi:hypothetical protein